MTPAALDAAIAAAFTARGARDLAFCDVVSMLEALKARGHTLSVIEATCDNGRTPRVDFMVYYDDEELAAAADTPAGRALASCDIALTFLRGKPSVPADIEFAVWLRDPGWPVGGDKPIPIL